MYMLFAGWEVPTVKNYDQGFENTARGRVFFGVDRLQSTGFPLDRGFMSG